MGAGCGKNAQDLGPLRPSVDLQTEWGTAPRIILSNKSPYRVSYFVLQEDKKRTRKHHRQIINSMGLRLNASSAGAVGGSADINRTSNVTVDTEETELYLMTDHRMEPMGRTQDTEVLFPVGCQELRVYGFFEEDGQAWECYKNKVYSIAPRKRNVLLTALRSNILPYTKARSQYRVESDDTKERKLLMPESAARTAERQSVAREAESKPMLKMLSAQTDAATANSQRKAEQAKLKTD